MSFYPTKNNTFCLKPLLIVVLLFLGASTLPATAQLSRLQQCPANRRIITLWYCTEVVQGKGLANAAAFFDSAKTWASQLGDKKLLGYAQVLETYCLASLQKNGEGRINFFLQQNQYFEHHPDDEIKGGYHFFLGNACYYSGRFEQAFHHLSVAENIFNEVGYANLPLAAIYGSDLFGFYYQFEDYKAAIAFAKITYQYADTATTLRTFTCNNMGVTYTKMKDYPSAAATFRQVMELDKKSTTKTYTGIASGNLGNVLRLQGQYALALPYLYTDVAINEKTVPDNSAITCLYIANCLLHLDSTAKARYYIAHSQQLQPNWKWGSYGVNYYENQSLYFQKTGNDHQALLYKDTLLQLKDSLRMVYDGKILMATTLKAKEEKYQSDKKKATLEARNVKQLRNFIIVFLLIAFALTLLFIYQKRKKEKRLAAEKQRKADDLLQAANRQLEQYISHIKEKNALIEKIEAELLQPATATTTAEADSHAIEQQLQQLHQSVIMTEEEWTAFKKLFQQVWVGFFGRIKEKYPTLTVAEERVLALCKLNLPSKDMAKMLGISIDSLRTSRYRLRKKLPLLMEDDEFKEVI